MPFIVSAGKIAAFLCEILWFIIFTSVFLGQTHVSGEATSTRMHADGCMCDCKVYHTRYLDIEFNGRIVSLWSMSAGLNLPYS